MSLQNDANFLPPDLDLAFIEGGSFQMGNDDEDAWGAEKIIHTVTVPSFYMAKFPVTQRLWIAVMGGEEYPSYFQGDLRPKTDVSWNDAKDFLEKLNALPEVQRFVRSLDPPGGLFRLPSEAEWEFAARGGNEKMREGFKYSGSNKLKEVGWFDENSHDETKPVGLKFPNELGIFDMSGNVWEWCEDYWHDSYEGAPGDGSAWLDAADEGADRVHRGGGYWDLRRLCRPSCRSRRWQGGRGGNLGFRLALSLQSVG